MTDKPELLRSRSARHYLAGGATSTKLRTTLTLAARTLSFPVAMINILDEDTLHTISLFGADDILATPREIALCDTVVRTGEPLIVEDATADPRFARFPAVVGRDVGSYLGVPLTGRETLIVGALCVIDSGTRGIENSLVARLAEFALIVEDQLDLMRRLNEQRQIGAVVTQELAEAINNRQIVPWYQPIIDLATGKTIGVEALARWRHDDAEITDPSRFIPLAEDSDLIIDLDLAIISQAAADLARWQQAKPEFRLNVNVSGRHFDHADFLPPIQEAVADSGVSTGTVDLELTETTHLGSRSTTALIHQLRDAGFGVWLDDFGTGWSSLDYLLRMPVTGVKIDRAMTLALGSRIGNALTTSVTALASELDLKTTIEGIQTADHARLARDLGCNLGQGYFWSPPVPFADISTG